MPRRRDGKQPDVLFAALGGTISGCSPATAVRQPLDQPLDRQSDSRAESDGVRDNQAFSAGPRPVARAGAPWIIFYFRRDVPLIREPADAYQYGTSGGLPAGAATTRKQEGTSVKFLTRVVREHSIDRSAKGGGHGDHCRTV